MPIRILIIFAALTAAFVIQQYRFLSFESINPNLLLVGLLFFVFRSNNFWSLIILSFSLAAVGFLFTPYWFLQVLAVLGLVLVFYFLKKIMTGNLFLDFLVSLALSTFVFYAVLGFSDLNLIYGLILGEISYNLILGTLLWFMLPFQKAK